MYHSFKDRHTRKERKGLSGYCYDCHLADQQLVRQRKAIAKGDYTHPIYSFNFPYVAWGRKLDACGYRCPSCHRKGRMTIDHVLALSLGGTLEIGNLEPLCFLCNVKKGGSNRLICTDRKQLLFKEVLV
jgi:5-methylcytosine-specific restriction endonuclease McrA